MNEIIDWLEGIAKWSKKIFDKYSIEISIVWRILFPTIVYKIWAQLQPSKTFTMRPLNSQIIYSIQDTYKVFSLITLIAIIRAILSIWLTSRTKGKKYYHIRRKKTVTIEHNRVFISLVNLTGSSGRDDNLYFSFFLKPLPKDTSQRENLINKESTSNK